MAKRSDRLRKLLDVQHQLKALHETRHAGFVAGAAAARQDADDLVDRFNAEDSMATMFPEVYNRRIGSALNREKMQMESARVEAGRVATATLRSNMVERAYRDASRHEDRQQEDRERLDMLGNAPPARGSGG